MLNRNDVVDIYEAREPGEPEDRLIGTGVVKVTTRRLARVLVTSGEETGSDQSFSVNADPQNTDCYQVYDDSTGQFSWDYYCVKQ